MASEAGNLSEADIEVLRTKLEPKLFNKISGVLGINLGKKWRIVEGPYPSGSSSPSCLLFQITKGSGDWTTIASFKPDGTLLNSGAASAIPTIPSSLPPSGAAGGVLSGTYPNPGFNTGSTGVTSYTTPLASDFSTAVNGMVSVTGFSFSVVASGMYDFEFIFSVTSSAAGTPTMQITGPASPTYVTYGLIAYDPVAAGNPTGMSMSYGQAFSTTLTPPNTGVIGAPGVPYWLRGLLRNGANAGTIQFQMNSGGVTAVIKAGSFIRYVKVN